MAGHGLMTFGHFCANVAVMKRDRFLSDLRRYCRKNGIVFDVDSIAGKGGHAKVYCRRQGKHREER
jgi:hypothetical protein